MGEITGDYNPDRDDIFINNEDGTWTVYGEGGEVTIYDPEKKEALHDSPDGSTKSDDEIFYSAD